MNDDKMKRRQEGGADTSRDDIHIDEVRERKMEILREKGEDMPRDLKTYTATVVINEAKECKKYSPQLVKRLESDLLSNSTCDYSRMNLTEVFAMLGFEVNPTITHWRLAKIMDAIVLCHNEFKISPNSLLPHEIPAKIYEVFRKGKQNDKEQPDEGWPIEVINPENGQKSNLRTSLVDLAYFMDVLKANRELGMFRMPLNELVYNYFTGGELKVNIKTPASKGGSAAENEVDLKNNKLNPRDDYDDIDIKEYLESVNRRQMGLQQMGEWRWTSEGHREMGGHASVAEVDGIQVWIPGSGEQAQILTLTDLQKNPAEKKGQMGQPQEVGDMDEKGTGAIV